MTLHSLAHLLTTPADHTRVAWEGSCQYTRADFLHGVAQKHQALLSRHEKRWLLHNDNSYHFAVNFFALLAAGKHIVLPPNAQAGTLAALSNFFDADFTTLATTDITNTDATTLHNITLDVDALTITLLTSGSTGTAKAITKTLRCLDAEIQTLEMLWGKTLENAAVFTTVSHQHIYGLLFRLLWPLCAERPFAATAHSYPEQLVAELQQQTRTVLISSPSQLKRFPTTIDLFTLKQSLCAVFSSGGLLPTTAAQDWQQRLGKTPIEVLGSTETGGVAWRQQTTTETPWQTLPEVNISIDSSQQLLVQSPFTGEQNAIAMGDCATLIDTQHFHLLGRADRIIKLEEKRLSLTAMEQCLQASPLVDEACVLALPQTPNRLGVVIRLRKAGKTILAQHGKQAVVQQLREQLHAHFERVLLPRKWRFTDELPTDAQGKVSHTALAALFFEQNENIRILSNSADQRVLQIHFAPNSSHFAGHFPELPILPGVVQFDIAVRECCTWYALTQFRGIEKLKFSEPIVPNDTVTLSLQHLGQGQVQFSYTLDEQALSSGRIIFEP